MIMVFEHVIFLEGDGNNCNWIGLRHSIYTNCTATRWNISPNITPALRTTLSQTPFYLLESYNYFYFCPISGWLWVFLAQKANWNSGYSSETVSCLFFSCEAASIPDSTVKPLEEDSSWKLPPCRRDYNFYPHHFFIYELASFSSCFKGIKKTKNFFSFSFIFTFWFQRL